MVIKLPNFFMKHLYPVMIKLYISSKLYNYVRNGEVLIVFQHNSYIKKVALAVIFWMVPHLRVNGPRANQTWQNFVSFFMNSLDSESATQSRAMSVTLWRQCHFQGREYSLNNIPNVHNSFSNSLDSESVIQSRTMSVTLWRQCHFQGRAYPPNYIPNVHNSFSKAEDSWTLFCVITICIKNVRIDNVAIICYQALQMHQNVWKHAYVWSSSSLDSRWYFHTHAIFFPLTL